MSLAVRAHRIADGLAAWLLHAGVLVLALIGLAATAQFGARLDAIWADLPGSIGFRGVAMAVAYVAAVAGIVMLIRRLGEPNLRRWMPWSAMLLLVAIRLLAIPLIETPLPADNDPLFLHELAVGVLDGGNWLVAHRPMGFSTMLAALYAVFGVNPLLAEVLNLALAAACGWMLYRYALGAWGVRAAATSLILYATLPSQILLVTTVFTEVAYSTFLMAAMLASAVAIRGGRLGMTLVAGALLGLSQYIRPLSQAFLASFVALPLLGGMRASRAAAAALLTAVSFLVVLTPIALHNLTTNGDLSLATSSYGGWSLFVGANQQHAGKFNRDDQAILRGMDGSIWERSEILGRAGLDRIAQDPRGFAELGVRKFRVMWGDDTYAVGAALAGSRAADPIRHGLELASQAAYAAVAVAAAIGMWRMRRRPAPEVVLVAGIIVTLAVAHTFVEVQPRYHGYVLPLLCAVAGLAMIRTSGDRAEEVPLAEPSP